MTGIVPDFVSSNSDEKQETIDRFLLKELEGELHESERRFEYFNLKANVFFADNYNALIRFAELWEIARRFRQFLNALRRRPDYQLPETVGVPEASSRALRQTPRILIDMTSVEQSEAATRRTRIGAQLAIHAAACGEAIPVYISNERIHYVTNGSLQEIQVRPKDLIVVDVSFLSFATCRLVASVNGHVVTIATDFEEFVRLGADLKGSGRRDMIDLIVTTSSSKIDDDFRRGETDEQPWRVIHWQPGKCTDAISDATSPAVTSLCADETPYFVSVGTLDLRLGYSVALSAFEVLWNSGTNIRYIIVGERGQQGYALETRILQHPEFNKRLFWLRKVRDADMGLIYAHASCLICAALDKSGRVSISDATLHGLSVIASDIPELQEAEARETTRYFKLLDSADLACAIEAELAMPKPNPDASQASWPEATARLMKILREAFQTELSVD